jgi:TolA-binding protein
MHRVLRHPIRVALVLASCVSMGLLQPDGRVWAQNSKENADFKLAINLYNDGLFDLALEQLKQFISSYPTAAQAVDARYYLGLTELRLKKYEDARLTFQTFALTYQDNPKAPEAWWNVGEAYSALRNFGEAALAYERVKVFHPKSKLAADALLKASKSFLLAGSRDDARRTLRVILQEYPSSGAVLEARTRLGALYFEEGNFEQAQSELKRVIEGDPSPDAKAGALLILGNIARETGRTDEARDLYRNVIAKYGTTSAAQGAYLNLGKILASNGSPKEALGNFRKALDEKSHPDSTVILEALIGTADAQADLEDNAAAVRSYEKYLSLSAPGEDSGKVLWRLARTAAKAKIYRKSTEACNHILSSNSADLLKERARLLLAQNAADQKDYQVAVEHYQLFADAHPDDPSTPGILLRIANLTAHELGDLRKGAAIDEQLAARYPRSAPADDALIAAARDYEQLKDFNKALQVSTELVRKYASSEFRAEAEKKIRTIQTFEAKEKDAGLEKLAILVGDVLAEKDKSSLAYRLGDIYYTDLKNYSAAAAQFSTALQGELGEARAADAMYKRARSLEFLCWTDSSLIPEAIEAYKSYIVSVPRNAKTVEAELAMFRLSAGDLPLAREAARTIDSLDTHFPRSDFVALTLGRLLEGADSLVQASTAYRVALGTTKDSSLGDEASYCMYNLLLRQDEKDSAIAAGQRYLAQYPSGRYAATVTAGVASLFLQENMPEKAVPLYRRLDAEFAYCQAGAHADRSTAEALSAAGDTAGAIEAYTDIITRQLNDPLNDEGPEPELLLALGQLHWSAGHDGEAKKYLIQTLRREKTGSVAANAYTTLGRISRHEGLLDVAASYFRQAEAADPGSPVSRDVADLLFQGRDYASAARNYAQLASIAKSDTERQALDTRVIVALFRADEPDQAQRELTAFEKKYRVTDDETALFELERGGSLFRKAQFTAAVKIFQQVAEKYDDSPSAPDAMYWIGKTLEASGRPRDAVQELEQLLQSHPDAQIIQRAQLALGNLYYKLEQWSQAIQHYRAIVDDPHADPALLPLAMSNLIETYQAAGAFDGALSLTRRYLDLYPNSDDAFEKKITVGILYERLGYYDQAILQLQSLLETAGSDVEAEIRYYIAEANYNKGDYQQAILDFLKVPYLVTKKGKLDWTANSLYMSGQSYEKMGRYDQALTMYQQIVERPGIDETFKSAARKEIDRVKAVIRGKIN